MEYEASVSGSGSDVRIVDSHWAPGQSLQSFLPPGHTADRIDLTILPANVVGIFGKTFDLTGDRTATQDFDLIHAVVRSTVPPRPTLSGGMVVLSDTNGNTTIEIDGEGGQVRADQVIAKSASGNGVFGESHTIPPVGAGAGVHGRALVTTGVLGEGGATGVSGKGSSAGVFGESDGGVGVLGRTSTGSAIKAESTGEGTALEVIGSVTSTGGISTEDGIFSRAGARRPTAIHGEGFIGVAGVTTSESGTGVVAQGTTALDVRGKVLFRRSGVVVLPQGSTSVSVKLSDLSAGSLVLATLQDDDPDSFVRAATVHNLAGSFVIHLNRRAARDLRVAWFVVG